MNLLNQFIKRTIQIIATLLIGVACAYGGIRLGGLLPDFGGILGRFFGGFFGFLIGLAIGLVLTGWDRNKSHSNAPFVQDLQYRNAQRARALIGERTD